MRLVNRDAGTSQCTATSGQARSCAAQFDDAEGEAIQGYLFAQLAFEPSRLCPFPQNR